MTNMTVPAREIVDTLSNARRDLIDAKIELRKVEADMLERKVTVVSRLLEAAGGTIPGKSEADRNRVIDDALALDPSYGTFVVGYQQTRELVDKKAVEVQVYEDYFSLARLEARVALAEALSASGSRLGDL